MNDPALHAGFTADGARFGYCAELGGAGRSVTCEWIDARGAIGKTDLGAGAASPPSDLRFPGIVSTGLTDAYPPALTGTWSFGDITVDVLRVAATSSKDGAITAPAVVKVGGLVAGESAPVHPLVLSNVVVPAAPPHFAVMNVLALSPDGRELGMVGHFFACEYCDSFVVRRMPAATFASLVYNDAGFRVHAKGDFARSARLFEKAVAADPTAKLASYNLACAWARTSDPRAKDALAHAIARDPSAKARAAKDEDFRAVRASPWFLELTR